MSGSTSWAIYHEKTLYDGSDMGYTTKAWEFIEHVEVHDSEALIDVLEARYASSLVNPRLFCVPDHETILFEGSTKLTLLDITPAQDTLPGQRSTYPSGADDSGEP